MTTGIQANGTDLDALFLPIETTKRADVNIDSNGGVDISNRFQEYTSGTKVATTNIQSGGTDLADLFQNIAVGLSTVTLTNQNIQSLGSGTQQAGWRLNTNGTADKYTTALGWVQVSASTDWIIPNAAASDDTYELYVTNSGDPLSGGTTGSWLPLTSQQSFWIIDSASTGGSEQAILAVSIRKNGGATVATGTITLEASWIL